MVYISDFADFMERGEALYSRDPVKIRCSTKMRGANDEVIFKITNDVDVVSPILTILTFSDIL